MTSPRSHAFGELVDHALWEKAMTTTELASTIGVNPATLYRYLEGYLEPKATKVLQICELLNLDVLHAFHLLGWLPDKYADEVTIIAAAHRADQMLAKLRTMIDDLP
ncbi:MAG TPA: helix-turn-helix transcriptional regulator [Candidatus Saccharimonadales bacterium]|nr:helix-turn-helix transcriptional regulator [Candidatus Saccharimonadales bacterium]